MGCQSPKLSLDLSPPWLHPSPPVADGDKKTKRIRQQQPDHDDDDDDEDEEEEHDPASSELRAYISRLEDELRKIEAFKRELPLTVIILNDAIERLKEEAKNGSSSSSSQGGRLKLGVDQTDNKTSLMTSAQLWSINTSSDQTTAHFLQLKPTEDNQLQLQQDKNDDRAIRCQYKSNSSETQGVKPSLNHTPYFSSPPKHLRDTPAAATNTNTDTDNLLSLAGDSLCLASPPPVVGRASPASKRSTLRGGGGRQIVSRNVLITDRLGTSPSPPDQRHKNHDEHGVFQAAGRKQRRCWSPDLHRRFIDALEQLGGSQVATPKQIREIMQVDGLTNDEVKSHLQKYRLHIRRLPNATMNLSRDSSDGVREGNGTTKSSKESPSPEGPLHLPVLRPDKSNSAASRCDDNSMGITVEEEEETKDSKGSYEEEDDEQKSEGSHCLSWREGH